jgi:hypothetical protein
MQSGTSGGVSVKNVAVSSYEIGVVATSLLGWIQIQVRALILRRLRLLHCPMVESRMAFRCVLTLHRSCPLSLAR